jgi:hypothetical protein
VTWEGHQKKSLADDKDIGTRGILLVDLTQVSALPKAGEKEEYRKKAPI